MKKEDGGKESRLKNEIFKAERPDFPKRAVVTAGMPYGNKDLHFGHIGGVFIHADVFARFLRDRIGKENVIFVSGTDCYGSPILESYRKLKEEGQFSGTIADYVNENHEKQKDALDLYEISLNLFGASALGRCGEIHQEISNVVFEKLYKKGSLDKLSTPQFFDPEYKVFLNGRQVVGQCPIEGCTSERGYADECSLGHQYMPSELINPKSTLSGKTPEVVNVSNWYFKLEDFEGLLKTRVDYLRKYSNTRKYLLSAVEEFLKKPVIYIKKNQLEAFDEMKMKLPNFRFIDNEKKSSVTIELGNLSDRDKARSLLSEKGIYYRTGKTLVPFRLTGNIEWGVKAPDKENLKDLTFWVWPESLWAPISFTKAYLESLTNEKDDPGTNFNEQKSCDNGGLDNLSENKLHITGKTGSSMGYSTGMIDNTMGYNTGTIDSAMGYNTGTIDCAIKYSTDKTDNLISDKDRSNNPDDWKKWWCSLDSRVYQFIGEDNIYFYGIAEMAMFMALQEHEPDILPKDGELTLPHLISNNHVLFMDKKASSSGSIKPPMAKELLGYYTAEQLRMHFLSYGLDSKSVSFQPKVYRRDSMEGADPVLKEGSLLTNVFNRLVRSCFYTAQKYYASRIPEGDVSETIIEESEKTILEYERHMYMHEFHRITDILDTYIRSMNKYWVNNIRIADNRDDDTLRKQILIDTLHAVRVSVTLLHPIAPSGCEMVREYLGVGEKLWSWDYIFRPLEALINNKKEHHLKFLEPRVDFFKKHQSQLDSLE